MRSLAALLGLVLLSGTLLVGCVPELGECNEAEARRVVYSADEKGRPAYAGQALVDSSCGSGTYCHAEEADDRHGVPAGLDFDVRTAENAVQLERLRRGQLEVYRWRYGILDQVQRGNMPPGKEAALQEELHARRYAGLPPLDSPEGEEILRNWLACGVPVVEGAVGVRPPGVEPVGAVVASRPTVAACTEGELFCDGRCVDTLSNPAHCGDCGNACPIGRDCVMGMCSAACGAGLTECGGRCVDTSADGSHCGGCDSPCADGLFCAAGECVGGCFDPPTVCGASCVDTTTSILHCGGCDQPCASGESCTDSECDCGDTTSDPLNCGTCGNVCPQGADCAGSTCVCSDPGFEYCAGRCIDTGNDPANCGACGRACPSGQHCEGGDCIACGAGISFANDVQPIFTTNCTDSKCHDSRQPSGMLNLLPGSAYGNLVGVPGEKCQDGRLRVDPGNPDASYILHKLTGMNMCAGDQMPLRETPLPSAQLALISEWICAGAPNN